MNPEPITFRRLRPEDGRVLENVAEGAFDHPVRADSAAAFLRSAEHEMVVALEGDLVVGFASGNLVFHPDKPPLFWVNELGTAEKWRRRGIGRVLVEAMVAIARMRGCPGLWLSTEADNAPAIALYRAAGGREVTGLVLFDRGGAADV